MDIGWSIIWGSCIIFAAIFAHGIMAAITAKKHKK
jgi:hypothetical protein